MPDTIKTKLPNYTMKMRIYPSSAQKESIEKIFRALQIAYNITFHEVFQKNEMVCSVSKKDGTIWPDFRKMAKAEWRAYLISQNSAVADAPAAAITTNNGLFLLDGKRAWQNGMNNRPVDYAVRKEFRFYNANKPRRSFMVQVDAKNISPSRSNGKVAWISIPKVAGRIKARGFNRKLWFGKDGEHTYEEALAANELAKDLTVRVSKDSCGDYFVSITFSDGTKHERELYIETPAPGEVVPVGIDVGIKDVAILSTGEKIENKHFKKEKDHALRSLNRQLSTRWGPANMAFRDYNREIRKENRRNEGQEPLSLSKPSNRYLATQQKKARLERKIARRRETYYHQQTARIVQESSMLAIESLLVKNMLRNHKLAYALSDAAMSDFLSKLQYKAERFHVPILQIGTFEPSSQLCSVCGEQSPAAKNLSVRAWTCPKCGTRHDRDINAAKNILAIAQEKGTAKEAILCPQPEAAPVKRRPRKPNPQVVFADTPEIVAVFSMELSTPHNARYVIMDEKTRKVIDDAQGVGYRSISNAKNCYKAKMKYSVKLNNNPQ